MVLTPAFKELRAKICTWGDEIANLVDRGEEEKAGQGRKRARDELLQMLGKPITEFFRERVPNGRPEFPCRTQLRDLHDSLEEILECFNEGIEALEEETFYSAAGECLNAIVLGWEENILLDFVQNNNGWPSGEGLGLLLNRADYSLEVFHRAAVYSKGNPLNRRVILKNIIQHEQNCLTARGFRRVSDDSEEWKQAYTLSDESMERRKKEIAKCSREVEQLPKQPGKPTAEAMKVRLVQGGPNGKILLVWESNGGE